ncbi:MAG: hypothetical protein AAB975_01680, partial [Patescibacteria group bacterium]
MNQELADLILKEKTAISRNAWKAVFNKFLNDITGFVQPLGHGTASGHLESILQYGLGARKPPDASSPCLNSMCDLKKRDGLIASYAFATWNKTNDLGIDARQITKRDVIDRYAEVNPLIDSWLKKFILRRIATKYIKTRGKRAGYGVLLVYDGEGSAICNYCNRAVPSEVDCITIIHKKQL